MVHLVGTALHKPIDVRQALWHFKLSKFAKKMIIVDKIRYVAVQSIKIADNYVFIMSKMLVYIATI